MRTPDTLDPAVERELAALDAALAGDRSDPALSELTALVRAERPVPVPRWADALDERVAAGFPRPPRRRRLRLPLLPTAAAVLASAFVALVIAAGLLDGGGYPDGGGGETGGGAAGGVSAQEAEPAVSGGAAADSTGSIAPPPGAADDADGVRPRRVERSAYLTLAAPGEELARLGDRIIAVTDGLGGFVRSSNVQSGEMGGGGAFELRVPADRLDRALAQLSRLAHVRERTQAAQDITGETLDTAERLADARAERRALRRALAAAGDTREAARARAGLRRVAREIAAAQRALRAVQDRAAYATIQIALVADDDAGAGAPGDGRWTPGEALDDAVRVLEILASLLLVILAVAIPVGALVVGGRAARRWLSRSRRERAVDAA
jgi:hypothetical protein